MQCTSLEFKCEESVIFDQSPFPTNLEVQNFTILTFLMLSGPAKSQHVVIPTVDLYRFSCSRSLSRTFATRLTSAFPGGLRLLGSHFDPPPSAAALPDHCACCALRDSDAEEHRNRINILFIPIFHSLAQHSALCLSARRYITVTRHGLRIFVAPERLNNPQSPLHCAICCVRLADPARPAALHTCRDARRPFSERLERPQKAPLSAG